MKLSLSYVVVNNNGQEFKTQVEQIIFDAHMLSTTAHKWAWGMIKNQSWEYISQWVFEVNGIPHDIPVWGLKLIHGSCPKGTSVEDGGITEETFWLIKPFTAFTAEEVSQIERDWSSYEDDQWVLQDSSMPTGGVLMTPEYPTSSPVIELSTYVREILPFGR